VDLFSLLVAPVPATLLPPRRFSPFSPPAPCLNASIYRFSLSVTIGCERLSICNVVWNCFYTATPQPIARGTLPRRVRWTVSWPAPPVVFAGKRRSFVRFLERMSPPSSRVFPPLQYPSLCVVARLLSGHCQVFVAHPPQPPPTPPPRSPTPPHPPPTTPTSHPPPHPTTLLLFLFVFFFNPPPPGSGP